MDLGQLATVQQICKGKEKCPYRRDCPFETPPVDEQCALEVYYQQKWTNEYMNEYGVFPGERQLMSLIQSLVSIDIQLMRQNAHISQEGLEQYIYVEDENGKKKVDKKLHNLFALIDQLEKRRQQLLKQIKEETQTKQAQQVFGNIVDLLSKNEK